MGAPNRILYQFLSLPRFAQIKSELYRHRHSKIPNAQKTAAEIDLENFCKTLDGRPCKIVDETVDGKRIILCGTQQALESLYNAETVFMDGNFKIASPLYKQLYLFLSPSGTGKVHPRLFCFLPDKSFDTYSRMLLLIKNAAYSKGGEIRPTRFMIDYESAVKKAL